MPMVPAMWTDPVEGQADLEEQAQVLLVGALVEVEVVAQVEGLEVEALEAAVVEVNHRLHLHRQQVEAHHHPPTRQLEEPQ